jgi:hypothetical protein
MFEHCRPDQLRLEPVDRFEGARVRTTAIIGGQGQSNGLRICDREFGAAGLPRDRIWPEISPRWYAMTRAQTVQIGPDICVPLSTHFRIRAGCSTGAAYRLRDHVSDQEQSMAPRLVTTGAIDRYQMHWGRRQRFLGRDLCHPRWPLGEGAPSDVLRARDSQAGPKILVGGLTRVLEAWLDPKGEAAGIVSTWVIQANEPDLQLLQALLLVLNSATASRLYRQENGGASMSGQQVTIKKRGLLDLPLPRALEDQMLRAELAALAQGLCIGSGEKLNPAQDAHAHRRVAELYGRSKSEQNSDIEWWKEKGGFG